MPTEEPNSADPVEPDLSPEAFAGAPNPDDSLPEKPDAADGETKPAKAEGEETPGLEAPDATDPLADPPEFWSKERKALWAKADPELRQAILDHDKEARSNHSKRIEEASLAKKKAEELSQQAIKDRDDLANWWQQTGPKLAQQFQDKWAQVDWQKLAAEDPARYTVLKQAREDEANVLGETIRKHEAEVQASTKRAALAHQEVRRSEHQKLAEKLPDYFGKPEVAQKTYDELATYLVDQGIPKDRIPAIYEAAVVEIALKALRFDKAQKAAKTVAQPKPGETTQPVTVKPAGKSNDGPQSSAEREAMKKLRSGGRVSREDASILFA